MPNPPKESHKAQSRYNFLPNALSLLRVCIGPLVLVAYSNSNALRYKVSLLLLLVALLSDFLDGYIARKIENTSRVGYILDGIGDRAVYLALVLALLKAHPIPLILAWLLLFREIVIYAQRLMIDNWAVINMSVRRYSRWHALGIRCWFLGYLVADGLKIFKHIDPYHDSFFLLTKDVAAVITILVSYFALAKSWWFSSRQSR